MTAFLTAIFYQPLFNALIWLYNVIPGHDMGVAIILLTLAIRFILYPLTAQSLKSQKALQELQPKIKALQTQYKDQQEKLAAELMALYKAEKVNPMSSCLPVLIQLPFLIAIYRAFMSGLKSESFNLLYPFVSNPGTISTHSMGFLELSKPNIVLAIAAGIAQFWQTKMMISRQSPVIGGKHPEGAKDEDALANMNKSMMYAMPLMTVLIGASLPGGLSLYWFVTTLLMGLQQFYIFHKHDKEKAKKAATTTDTTVTPS